MNKLLLIGGGGHCRACIDVIESENKYQIKGVIQPLSEGVDRIFGYSVLGSDEHLPYLLQETPHALVTVGQIRSSKTRQRLYKLLKKLGAKLPEIVSPFAYCSNHAEVDEGTIIMHNATVNAGATIGANCIINCQALIEHDVMLAAHCHVSTGARINGGVTIGEGSFIGSGAIIKQGVKIGANVIISAGQIILHDVPSYKVIKHG